MVLTTRTMGEGGGGKEEIMQFAPLLPLGFQALMFAVHCRLSKGAMGEKDRLGIVWVARG
jgi:hypothetical protein